MKVYYDNEVDALYLKMGDETPEGVIEISEGVNLDTTSEDKIVGIEILNASKKIDLKTILSYTLEFPQRFDNSKDSVNRYITLDIRKPCFHRVFSPRTLPCLHCQAIPLRHLIH